MIVVSHHFCAHKPDPVPVNVVCGPHANLNPAPSRDADVTRRHFLNGVFQGRYVCQGEPSMQIKFTRFHPRVPADFLSEQTSTPLFDVAAEVSFNHTNTLGQYQARSQPAHAHSRALVGET
eukprot:TRINITY_DN9516_c0_g1_i6.p2 TRINITY_DN9516_c0_g1~~TRINITY_DN9516_c0_g1_i6.p2  ORF type:complete len:121 (+),score=14.91 TRINITY_DN9516_c0_g1_i6:794-1156(+)